MIYRNVELHNVAEVVEYEDGSFSWLRVPQAAQDTMENGEQSIKQNICGTGVEIRFVMKSDTVTVRMTRLRPEEKTTNLVHLYRGGFQGCFTDNCVSSNVTSEICDIVINKFDRQERLEKMTELTGTPWDPEVIRLCFDRGRFRIVDIIGDVEPPKASQKPAKTLLCYGSSITHGEGALTRPSTWVSQVAQYLNVDKRNMGFGGACRMEPKVVSYISELGQKGLWDFATLELGINALTWEEEKIYERVRMVLDEIPGKNPDKPVVVISPFYCYNDAREAGKAKRWREIIEEVVAEKAYPNVTYISGLELLDGPQYLCCDCLHPSAFGYMTIASRLIPHLEAWKQ